MNYKLHYYRLIENAKTRILTDYKESQHIIPKCMGGSDDKDNLVELTAREHFIAHLLLLKIHPNQYGLIKAVNMMCCYNKTKQNRSMNRMYGWLKEKMSCEMSETQLGENNSQYGTIWIHNLQLKESKKIPKEDFPSWKHHGWLKGRKIKFKDVILQCKNCRRDFIQKTKELYCSIDCRKEFTNPNMLGITNNEKEEIFIKYYREFKSVNKALKMMGYPGNVGDHSKWAKMTLDNYLRL
jgi:hypothetical protein